MEGGLLVVCKGSFVVCLLGYVIRLGWKVCVEVGGAAGRRLLLLRVGAGRSRTTTEVVIIKINKNNGGTIGQVVSRRVTNMRFVTIGASGRTLRLYGTPALVRVNRGLAGKLNTNTRPRVKRGTTRRDTRRVRTTLGNTSVMFIAYNVKNKAKANTTPIVTEVTGRRNTLAMKIIAGPFHFRSGAEVRGTVGNVSGLGRGISAVVIVPGSGLLRIMSEHAAVPRTLGGTSRILRRNVRNVASLVGMPSLVGLSFTSVRAIVGSGNVTRVNVNTKHKSSGTLRTIGRTITDPLLRAAVANTSGIVIGMSKSVALVSTSSTTSCMRRLTNRDTDVVFNTVCSSAGSSRYAVAIVTANLRGMNKDTSGLGTELRKRRGADSVLPGNMRDRAEPSCSCATREATRASAMEPRNKAVPALRPESAANKMERRSVGVPSFFGGWLG